MSDDGKKDTKKRAASDDADGKDEKKTKKAKTGEKKEKKSKKAVDTFQMNVNKAVDKKHEKKSLSDIIKLPPSALQGLSDKADPIFAEYGMKTIESMANWKYYGMAVAIAELGKNYEVKGKRDDDAKSNISKAVDKVHEKSSLKELSKASISAFKGLTEAADEHFTPVMVIRTIGDLAKNKYFKMAQCLTTLAQYETDA